MKRRKKENNYYSILSRRKKSNPKVIISDFFFQQKNVLLDGEDKEVTRSEAFEWFDQNYDSVREMMDENGMRLEPRPLPKLNDKFSKFRDEL